MAKTVIGWFEGISGVQRTFQGLCRPDGGFVPEDISVVTHHTWASTPELAFVPPGRRLSIDDLGPAVVMGPMVTALEHVQNGPTAAGLRTVLTNYGMLQGEADTPLERVRRGGALVQVETTDDARAGQAVRLIDTNGGFPWRGGI
jgi:hypothetical protein